MFHKNLKTAFVTLLLTSLLFAGIKHAAAATILTVYTDSVKK